MEIKKGIGEEGRVRDEKREKRKRDLGDLAPNPGFYTKCTCEVYQINMDLRLSTAILSIKPS